MENVFRPASASALPGRRGTNHVVTGLAVLSTAVVLVPLVAILFYLIYKGASSLNFAFFTHEPVPVGQRGGGMGNAIAGSGVILGLASLMGFRWGLQRACIWRSMGRGRCLVCCVGSRRMC